MNKKLPKSLGAFIWHFLKPYKRVVMIYIIIAMLAGLWGPFNSVLTKRIINLVSSRGDSGSLIWSAVFLALNFIIFDSVTWRSLKYLELKFCPVIKNKIISDTLQFVLGSSNQFFNDNLSGRVASQINTLARNIDDIFSSIAKPIFCGLSIIPASFVAMYHVNLLFCIVLGVWLIVFVGFSISLSNRFVTLSTKHARAEANVAGEIVDDITNASSVRLFARRGYEIFRIENSLLSAKKTWQDKTAFLIMLNFVQSLLVFALFGFLLYVLIHLHERFLVTAGDFAMILGLSIEIIYRTWYTMIQVDLLNKAVGECKQSLDSLIVPQEIKDKQNAKPLLVTDGKIVFDKLTFDYNHGDSLFGGISLTIQAGQKVGLVGYSGGGKTSFVNLILRLYEVTAGHILIDDQDIRGVTQDSLRANISMIPQDPSLFHRTLMENIRYGRLDASDEEVVEAAKKAHAHEFIDKLPNKYETPVGERGIKLSGGQRQRVAIARAILKNAPILILDEATSQLDSVTESLIQDSLWELMQEKTVLVIAHRLSTLLCMDRILVFDQGKIVGDGSHSELLNKNELYKTLWNAQVGGFLLD